MRNLTLRRAVIAAVLPLLMLAGCGDRTPKVNLEAVKKLVANHQYTEAQQSLAAFEVQTGGTARSDRMMIDTQLGLGDGFTAEVYLKKLGERDISVSERKTLLAHSLVVRDRPFDAITVLTEQLPKSAWTSETYRIAIWALRSYDRRDSANSLLAEGLSIFPRNAQLLALEARNRLDVEDLDGASANAGLALKANPRNFEAHLISAEVALRQNRADDALRHYRAAHAAFPNDPLPMVNIAGILIDQGRLAEAGPVVTKGLNYHPGLPLLMFQQARIYVQKKDFLAAQRSLNSAWHALETYVPAQILSARVSIALGNRATAEAMLTRAAQDPRFTGDIAALRTEFNIPPPAE